MSSDVLERVEAELREIRKLVAQRVAVEPAAVNQADAARMLGVSSKHIGRMVRRGLLTPRDIGGARRFPVSELRALLEMPTPPASSGATPERVRYDAAAALAKLAELRRKRR